jgi:hypothetical protein
MLKRRKSMDYVMLNCPKCKRELPIPSDLKECICMYCGEHFSIEERASLEEVPVETPEMKESYLVAFNRVDELISDYDKLLPRFTREGYPTSFEEYIRLGESILLPINQYARLQKELWDQILGEISGKLMTAIEKNITANKGIITKNSKAVLIDQHRFFLAVYLIPMLGNLKLELSDVLADRIMEDWKKRYPKSEYKKATYEELAVGFMRKGFCFITTAVCDTFHKPEDCYELTRFREFRDSYLMSSEEGSRLVEEYYFVAPRIVTYLNMQPDSEDRYRKIWEKYLRPCLEDIERGHNQRCTKRYVRMVRELNSELPFACHV